MNDSLIKQLELAIQVERGEVDQMEVQCRRKGVSEWTSPAVRCSSNHGWDWNLESYEYRRKPKPLDRWFLLYADQSAKSFISKEGAEKARDKEKNSYPPPTQIVHMREVTNE